MFISDKKIKSFSFRTYKNLKTWYLKNKRFSRLSLGLKKSFGRGNCGRVLVHSKGSIKSRLLSNIMVTTYKGFLVLSCLIQIKFDFQKTGVIGLFTNSVGCWFNSLLPSGFFLFDYIRIHFDGLDKKTNIATNYWPRFLYDIPPHSRICSIEIVSFSKLSSGIKFIRSAGSKGLLLDNKYKGSFSIVVLPSLKVKVISSNSVAFLNFIENELNKYLRSKKAGFYVNKGRKPTVRGIVKNPCDHPNGGRAKTVLCSKTPWGKTAKKSRKPGVVVNLKSLDKRSEKKTYSFTNSNSVTDIFNNHVSVKSIPKMVADNLLISNI